MSKDSLRSHEVQILKSLTRAAVYVTLGPLGQHLPQRLAFYRGSELGVIPEEANVGASTSSETLGWEVVLYGRAREWEMLWTNGRQAELPTSETPWISLEASLLLELPVWQPENEETGRNLWFKAQLWMPGASLLDDGRPLGRDQSPEDPASHPLRVPI